MKKRRTDETQWEGPKMHADIIRVTVVRDQSGWYVATSDDMPSLLIAHEDYAAVIGDIPITVKAIYKANGVAVIVAEGFSPAISESSASDTAWVTMPAHIAAEQIAAA